MSEYSYEMIDGHIILNVNDSFFLLDTGAPSSIGLDSIRIGDSTYQVPKTYMGINAGYLTQEIGCRIDGLIGADIIADFTMTIDTVQSKVLFESGAIELPISLPIDEFMGIPILEISVNGSHIRAFFDTGARLSYINAEFCEGMVPAGKMEDFYPGIGKFTTDIFELFTTIGSEELRLLYGNLPPLLQMTLMMADTQAIIGTEVLKSYSCSLSLPRRELGLKKTAVTRTSTADLPKNAFTQVLRKAEKQRWCVKPYCTTCGARDFRSALHNVGGEIGGSLADALAKVDLNELMSFRGWDDALAIALGDLPFPGQATAVFEAWLERADQNVEFLDVVLYKFVRFLPKNNHVRQKWIDKAVSLSIETRDFSLVETTLLTLGETAVVHEQLIAIARGFAETSKQMRRVLRNACKLDAPRP